DVVSVNLLRSQMSLDRQSGFKKSCSVFESVCTCPFSVKCPKEFPASKEMSRMNEKHKDFFIGLGARAYRIQILSVNRPGQVIALGHYRWQIFDDLIHASRERSTIRSAKRGNSADNIQQLTSRMRQRQTLAPWQRSPEGIVREIPIWRCLFPLRCQNEPLRWNYGALVLASRLLGLGLRPSVPGYLLRHATGD